MKLVKFFLSMLAIFSLAGPLLATEIDAQRDARMKWWREARFGMFIHWGLYSGLAGTWDGKTVGTQGGMEWIQNYVGADTNAYAKAAGPLFNPSKNCIEPWIALAKASGCKYVVLTSKHHEGFCLFNSQFTNYNIYKFINRDLVKEFFAACKKHGLKAGLYYSVIDWNYPDYGWDIAKGLPYPKDNKKLYPHPDHAKYQEYLHNQVRELVSNYGKIDILWWDYSDKNFDGETAWKAPELLDMVKEKQPDIIMNNRLYASNNTHGDLLQTPHAHGDFTTPEQHVPASGIPDDWEVCMTLNTTWGYSAHDNNWKTPATLIENIVSTVSKGGNMLLNIGPKADGSLTRETVDSFNAIGDWMKVNSDSIYATTASPFKNPFPWGYVTTKGHTLYLSVFHPDKMTDGKILLPISNKTGNLSVLGHKTSKPEFTVTEKGWEISAPDIKANPAYVIKVEFSETPVILKEAASEDEQK